MQAQRAGWKQWTSVLAGVLATAAMARPAAAQVKLSPAQLAKGGNGVAALVAGHLTFSASTVDFGEVPTGSYGRIKLTMTNTGGRDFQLISPRFGTLEFTGRWDYTAGSRRAAGFNGRVEWLWR